MDFIKKFYLIKISKSSSSKKSILDHKRLTLSDINSDESLISDSSDDEQAQVIPYRQKSIQKKTTKKPQFEKDPPLNTLYFDKNHNTDQLLHLTIKIQKKNHHQDPEVTKQYKNKEKAPYRKDKTNVINSNGYYSTMYTPFTKRPEIAEDDYIPLPTVTRKYIDPPPDSIIDSIPNSFRIRRIANNKLQQFENPPSLMPLKKRLYLNSKRHSIGNGQMDKLLASNRKKHIAPPNIIPWLITRRNSISIETHASKKMCYQ